MTLPPLPEPGYWSTRDDDTPLFTSDQMRDYARAALAAVPAQPFAPDWVTYRQGVADGAAQSVPVPAGWVPMHERAPDPDTECVVILRYSLDRPPFTAIDTWAMQREDPTGMGGPTMETGYGWNDNFDSDVIAWMPVLPHPPADWDQRLAMLAAAPKEQPHE